MIREYISIEEFLEQPKEVQKVFIKWYMSKIISELLEIKLSNPRLETKSYINIPSPILNFENDKLIIYGNCTTLKEDESETIKLFTLGELERFIEDKTGKKLKATYEDGQLEINICTCSTCRSYTFKIFGDDVLQGYWKVACSIAESQDKKSILCKL